MTCARARELMVAAAVDEIEPADRRDLESHSGSCPECAGERERVTGLIARLRTAEVDDPGPGYWAAYNRRIRERLEASDAAGWRRPWRFLPAAAAALLVVAVAVVAVRREDGARPGRSGEPGHESSGAAETELEGVLTRAAAASGAATVQRVLDDMLTDDPWLLDDELSLLTAEEREALVRDLTGA